MRICECGNKISALNKKDTCFACQKAALDKKLAAIPDALPAFNVQPAEIAVEAPEPKKPHKKIPRKVGLHALTEREREVAELVARGYTNAQIGRHFKISAQTAKTHLYRGCQKTGASNRIGLAHVIWRHERAHYECVIADLRSKLVA